MSAGIGVNGWQVTQLCLGYRAGRVLGPVDADLGAGRLHCLIGPNGAGKSTFLRYLAGILPKTSGKTLFGGQYLESIDRRTRARRIAFLAQERVCVWPLSVRDVVMLGRHPHGASLETAGAADWQAVEAAMQATDLGPFAARLVTDLSGGEKARVLLARVLATQADWLLLDEPVAGLDPRQQFLLMALLREQVRQGRSIVLVLHDLSLAARFADEILLLDQGLVQAQGRVEQVLTAQRLAQVFGLEADLQAQDQGYALQIHGVMSCMLDQKRVR